MIVTENLTAQFLRNPQRFLNRFLIRVPISQDNFRTTAYDDYILARNSSVTGYDLSAKSKRPIEIAELLIAKDPAIDLAGGVLGQNMRMCAHYSPFIERKITSITLDRSASLFFSAELSGCTLAFSRRRPTEILHIPPTELLNFKEDNSESYKLFEPDQDYKDNHNKRTVVIGMRRRYRNSWRFFKQTYVDARLSTVPNRSFSAHGYKFLRLSCFEEI
jgi:hypothetical protein